MKKHDHLPSAPPQKSHIAGEQNDNSHTLSGRLLENLLVCFRSLMSLCFPPHARRTRESCFSFQSLSHSFSCSPIMDTGNNFQRVARPRTLPVRASTADRKEEKPGVTIAGVLSPHMSEYRAQPSRIARKSGSENHKELTFFSVVLFE